MFASPASIAARLGKVLQSSSGTLASLISSLVLLRFLRDIGGGDTVRKSDDDDGGEDIVNKSTAHQSERLIWSEVFGMIKIVTVPDSLPFSVCPEVHPSSVIHQQDNHQFGNFGFAQLEMGVQEKSKEMNRLVRKATMVATGVG